MLLKHLFVKNLVRVRKFVSIGFRALNESNAAHETLKTAQVSLADFRATLIIKVKQHLLLSCLLVLSLAHDEPLAEKMSLLESFDSTGAFFESLARNAYLVVVQHGFCSLTQQHCCDCSVLGCHHARLDLSYGFLWLHFNPDDAVGCLVW